MIRKRKSPMVVVGFVKLERGIYETIFPEVPNGAMRFLRPLIRYNKAHVHRNSTGGINITAEDPRDPEATSNLALDIGDLNIGLSVDVETIPRLNLS